MKFVWIVEVWNGVNWTLVGPFESWGAIRSFYNEHPPAVPKEGGIADTEWEYPSSFRDEMTQLRARNYHIIA